MKTLRAADLTNAVPVADGRGHRSPQTLLAISERDHLLREAARRFCVGMSDRQAAAMLNTSLKRYDTGAWRRERIADICPPRHAGRLTAYCWRILRTRDAVPSEMTIRRALGFS